MQTAPFEVISNILGHLPTSEVANARLVCRSFNQVGKHIISLRQELSREVNRITHHAGYTFKFFKMPNPNLGFHKVELKRYMEVMTKLEMLFNANIPVPDNLYVVAHHIANYVCGDTITLVAYYQKFREFIMEHLRIGMKNVRLGWHPLEHLPEYSPYAHEGPFTTLVRNKEKFRPLGLADFVGHEVEYDSYVKSWVESIVQDLHYENHSTVRDLRKRAYRKNLSREEYDEILTQHDL